MSDEVPQLTASESGLPAPTVTSGHVDTGVRPSRASVESQGAERGTASLVEAVGEVRGQSAGSPIGSTRPAPAPARRPSRRSGRTRRRLGGRRLPRGDPRARRHLVLACGRDDVIAVAFDSGALVRLRVEWDDDRPPDLSPFDVVDAVLAADLEQDDLAQPEAVTVEGIPATVGSLRGRRARRLLRRLVAPSAGHLLGFPGTSWPYWEFRGMRPSVALVVPTRGPLLFRRRADDSVWARFGWPRSDNWLQVEDRRAIAALWAGRRDRLSGKQLATALGFRPHYLLVVLSRPRQGYCHKVVAAFLPRP